MKVPNVILWSLVSAVMTHELDRAVDGASPQRDSAGARNLRRALQCSTARLPASDAVADRHELAAMS